MTDHADDQNSPLVIEGPDSAVGRFLGDRFVQYCCAADPVSEREYANLFLEAANEGQLTLPDWTRLLGGAVSKYKGTQYRKLDADSIKEFRRIMNDIVEGNGLSESDFELKIEPRIDEFVASIPRLSWRKGRMTITHQVIGMHAEATLWYAFALLLSRFHDDLRRCQLETCGRFFLYDDSAEKRKYCRPEHRSTRIDGGSVYRKQASRAEVSVSEWLEILNVDPTMTVKRWAELKRASPRITPQKFVEQKRRRKESAMTITRILVSPDRLLDAGKRLWLAGRDAFLAAGGSVDAPSAVVLDETGRMHEVVLYQPNRIDRLAVVRIGLDGKLEPVEWL